jgi:hypothetical protein
MVKKKDYFGIPDNGYGWVSLITGLLASIMYLTQALWGWFGSDSFDKSLYSFIVLFLICIAIPTMYVANNTDSIKNPLASALRIFFFIFIGVLLTFVIMNGASMTLDVNYAQFTETSGGGLFTGFQMLSSITEADVNEISLWAIGVRQIIRAMFLVLPFLIATWGGLSVLTADSIDEAEGGILAIVSAFVVVIIVWMFKLVDVVLGS